VTAAKFRYPQSLQSRSFQGTLSSGASLGLYGHSNEVKHKEACVTYRTKPCTAFVDTNSLVTYLECLKP